MNLKFLLTIVLLVILISSFILLIYTSYIIVTNKYKVLEKANVANDPASSTHYMDYKVSLDKNKYFIIGPTILNLISILTVGFLVYKN